MTIFNRLYSLVFNTYSKGSKRLKGKKDSSLSEISAELKSFQPFFPTNYTTPSFYVH